MNPAVTNMFNVSHAPIVLAELHVWPAPIPTSNSTAYTAAVPSFSLLTDASWKASPSDTAHIGAWKNGNFGGDRVDARLSQPDWSSTSVDDSAWSDAAVYPQPHGVRLSSEVLEPNRLRDAVRAKTVMKQEGYVLVNQCNRSIERLSPCNQGWF